MSKKGVNRPLRYVSLFAGIGGFDLGFDRAGMECALQVDLYDPAGLPDMVAEHESRLALAKTDKEKKRLKGQWSKLCNQGKWIKAVADYHWPDVSKINGVQNVTNESIREFGGIDLICGGFPCQDVSVAGLRAGLSGKRSGLWFEFLRVIDDVKPAWVVIENVAGLLSSNGGRDMGAILGGLGQCGYWWAYRVLDSQFFGVPQRRRRVFIVASLREECPQEILFEPGSGPWDTAPSREAGPSFAAAITERTRAGGRRLEIQESLANTLFAPGSGGRSHSRLIAFGGNNTRGEISVATSCNAHGSGRYDFESETFILDDQGGSRISANDSGLSETIRAETKGNLPIVCFQQNTRNEIRLYDGDGGLAGSLSASPGMKQQNYIVTNAFNGYTGGSNDNDAQGWHIVPALEKTLNSSGNDGGFRTEPGAHLVSPSPWGVRRLTPLECERLQGFPDGWTKYGLIDGKPVQQSDSARYRQLGNAVTMPVAEWLGLRIMDNRDE